MQANDRAPGRYEVFSPEQIDKMTEQSAKVAVDALQRIYIPKVSYWAAVEGALISLFLGGILYAKMGVTGIYLGIALSGLVKKFTDALFSNTKHAIKQLFKKKDPPDENNSPPDQPAVG